MGPAARIRRRKVVPLLALALAAALCGCARKPVPEPCPVIPLPKSYDPLGGWVRPSEPAVEIVSDLPGVPDGEPEGYILEVGRRSTKIRATAPEGVLNARKTLAQLTGGDGLAPLCRVVDYPSFPVRGFMVDCGRTFVPVEELQREIEVLSAFKMNVFHWHLTENQAWRLESERHPGMTSASSMTRDPGLFYTREQARALEEFCRERGVLLVPEIDLPGHSAAFARATGHDMQSPEGREVLLDLLDEAARLFEGEYFHIGTDEVDIKDTELVREAVSLLHGIGKKVVAWNPGHDFSGGGADATMMWSYRGAPTPGIPAVDCRFHYLNHFDGWADIVAMHASTIYGKAARGDGIAGAVAAVWNDRYLPYAEDHDRMAVENRLYPAAIALADRSWRGGGYGYFDAATANLSPDPGDPMTRDFMDWERRLLMQRGRTLPHDLATGYVSQGHEVWNITEPQDNGGDLSMEWDHRSLPSRTVRGGGVYLRHTWAPLVPGFIQDPRPNSTVYAYTYVHSGGDRVAGMYFQTQNHSRSEKDLPPPQGCWDDRGSYVAVNGQRISPPVWTEDLGRTDPEAPMGNLNEGIRTPTLVQLRKGWNEIVVKLPVGEFRTGSTRLVKWAFTLVLTGPDGRDPLPVAFSPAPEGGAVPAQP